MTSPEPEVRADLRDAHQLARRRWAAPGAWWTGADRIAIVAESRRARSSELLPAWVAPTSVDGLIPSDHPLPDPAIDVVWRLTCHPGSLTRSWFDEIVGGGLEPLAYVELVALVAMAASVDTFARAAGLEPPALPAPIRGTPSRQAPAQAAVSSHWVPTATSDGPNVLRALSAVPAEQPALRALAESHYLPAEALMGDLAWTRGTLDRMQIELIASRTSALNECFY